MPKISVIVPVYNVEKYISTCLESLLKQTLSDIEIICVDDCGTDESMRIVEKIAKTDKRIKIIHNEQNSGLSESRNNGMKCATAPYIMFCDSDDWFAEDMCEKMYTAITCDNADLAICGTEVIYEADHDRKSSDDRYFAIQHGGTIDLTQDIQDKYSVCAWNKIYKREIINKYNVLFPRGLKYEDNYFYSAYCLWVKRVAFVSDKLYKYRRRAGSIMNNTYGNKVLNLDTIKIAIAWFKYATEHNKINEKTNWFWGKFFYELVCNSLDYSSKDNHKKCYEMAQKFIQENLDVTTLDNRARRNIAQIMHRTIKPRRMLGGLIKIQTTPDETFLRVCGVKVLRAKYDTYKTKYYLMGMRVFHKSPTAKIDIPELINKPDFNDKNLLAELKKLGRFTYIPNPGNIGDMLIASATYDFFKRNHIKFNPYQKHTNPGKNIVYGGGGIWTADYEKDWCKFLPWFQKAKRIVILPGSFNNCQKLIDILDERFVVFCREKRSYEYLKSANTRAKILLDHDMAFRLKNMPKQINIVGKGAVVLKSVAFDSIPQTALFMRVDRESAGKYKTDLDVSDITYGMHYDKRDWIDYCTGLMMNVINRADTIVTDRLHVAIMAHLLNKQVYMMDNTYGKLSAVYEHSMKQFENVDFCTTMPEL